MLRAAACAVFLACLVCAGCQHSTPTAAAPAPPVSPVRQTAGASRPAPQSPPAQASPTGPDLGSLWRGGEAVTGGPTRTDLIPPDMGAPVGR
jgi:hypothetical protein